MAKKSSSRLDVASLQELGAERLAAILLEEAAVNKPLKARLQTALAGNAGPGEVARLIDKRLDTIARSRSGLGGTKARELGHEIAGLKRNIVSELAGMDQLAAAERLIRLVRLRLAVYARLYEDSAVLDKAFTEAWSASVELMGKLDAMGQRHLVPMLHAIIGDDAYGEMRGFMVEMIGVLSKDAAALWTKEFEELLAGEKTGRSVFLYLQALARRMDDLDAYMRYEAAKPEVYRDSYTVAELLYGAGRFEEALSWVRRESKGMRPVEMNGRVIGYALGTDIRISRQLEAEILDALKRRDEAQTLRWRQFAETLDVGVLRTYIAKLDDFAEFEELDKAFALVNASDDVLHALEFFIAWPKLDLAAALVLKAAMKWNGRFYDTLAPAADALSETQPLAATVLYRVLLSDILDRGQSSAYPYAAEYLAALHHLSSTIETWSGIDNHQAYAAGINKKHGRKYGFWSLVPKDLRI